MRNDITSPHEKKTLSGKSGNLHPLGQSWTSQAYVRPKVTKAWVLQSAINPPASKTPRSGSSFWPAPPFFR